MTAGQAAITPIAPVECQAVLWAGGRALTALILTHANVRTNSATILSLTCQRSHSMLLPFTTGPVTGLPWVPLSDDTIDRAGSKVAIIYNFLVLRALQTTIGWLHFNLANALASARCSTIIRTGKGASCPRRPRLHHAVHRTWIWATSLLFFSLGTWAASVCSLCSYCAGPQSVAFSASGGAAPPIAPFVHHAILRARLCAAAPGLPIVRRACLAPTLWLNDNTPVPVLVAMRASLCAS
mmetsp:Transcript_69183/g.122354  ORF Transcript_69183/g.122354 Transcript_69183/m.122354 type:complete len:239 (+) Transcript_69183:1728-2444(+)